MAKATVEYDQPRPIKSVTLELTADEVQTVRSLLAHVAGSNEVYDILGALEAELHDSDYDDISVEFEGEYPVIRFA